MIELKKIIVIYDSKYGNTKLAAEKILEGIKESQEIETAICYVKEISLAKASEYDTIVLGMPNHMGRPSRTMTNFVTALAKSKLKATRFAVFGTYAGKVRDDRAVKKIEKMMEKISPNLKQILPGLSIKVDGIPGPISEGELPRCVDFGRKIAKQINE